MIVLSMERDVTIQCEVSVISSRAAICAMPLVTEPKAARVAKGMDILQWPWYLGVASFRRCPRV